MRILRLFLILLLAGAAQSQPDRFHYGETDRANRLFGPEDWDEVRCDNINTCPGWPTNWEKFKPFIPYAGTPNYCLDCADSNEGICEEHIQSPIHLLRNVTAERECLDRHRMNYVEGNCKLGQQRFVVLPHVLRVYHERCRVKPLADFSLGFPFPWVLKFTDVSVPSQHMMDGKRYPAEIVMSHVYSVDNGAKQIGNIVVLLERGRAADEYDFLELYLRQWSIAALKIQRACARRVLIGEFDDHPKGRRFFTNQFKDLVEELLENFNSSQVEEIQVEEAPDDDDVIILNQIFSPPPFEPQMIRRRYYSRQWHPYDWYDKTDTEYYFRYQGSVIEPPCIGESGFKRRSFVHWRVLKDPIKVAPRQLTALDRLIANRIDPDTCEPYTAGKKRTRNGWRVDVNRPIQTTTDAHRLVFCECRDWRSRAPNDVEYCNLSFEARGVSNVTWEIRADNYTDDDWIASGAFNQTRE